MIGQLFNRKHKSVNRSKEEASVNVQDNKENLEFDITRGTSQDTSHANQEFDEPLAITKSHKVNSVAKRIDQEYKGRRNVDRTESSSSSSSKDICKEDGGNGSSKNSTNGSSINSDRTTSRKLPPLPKMKTSFSSSNSRKTKPSTPHESKYWFNLMNSEQEDKIVSIIIPPNLIKIEKV